MKTYSTKDTTEIILGPRAKRETRVVLPTGDGMSVSVSLVRNPNGSVWAHIQAEGDMVAVDARIDRDDDETTGDHEIRRLHAINHIAIKFV